MPYAALSDHQGVIKRKCITKILSFELQVSITHPITHSLPLHTLGVLHTPFLHYTLCNTPLVGVYLIIHVNVCNTCVLQSGYHGCADESMLVNSVSAVSVKLI